ncbi:MAG TPA: serine protease [Bacteroidales bacterium]|nr:serine protease [Bacteroidales bacterium]
MKKAGFPVIVLFIFLNLAPPSSAQTYPDIPHSLITFVRSGNMFGSACRTDITFPNQASFNLSLSSLVKYTIYSAGEMYITLETFCPGSTNSVATSSSQQLKMEIERGKEYYVFYNAGIFKEVEKEQVRKYLEKLKNVMVQEENLDTPINRASFADLVNKSGASQGTCFLISSEGYLVTNYHCVENATAITVKGINGDFTTRCLASVVATDPSNDLALLKLSNHYLKLAAPPYALRTAGVAQAEKIFVLGYPAAQEMGEEIKVTEGIISAKSGVQGDISKFQISAGVNPGNSGGMLIDEQGNLIGVIYAKSTIAESAGYAIKAIYLDAFLRNVEGFTFPEFVNTIKDKPLTEKIAELKNFVFILETE